MTLSHRAEQAKPEEARALLEELLDAMWHSGRIFPGKNWLSTFAALKEINTPESILAATLMLRGTLAVAIGVKHNGRGTAAVMSADGRVLRDVEAENTALALIAAVARSGEH